MENTKWPAWSLILVLVLVLLALIFQDTPWVIYGCCLLAAAIVVGMMKRSYSLRGKVQERPSIWQFFEQLSWRNTYFQPLIRESAPKQCTCGEDFTPRKVHGCPSATCVLCGGERSAMKERMLTFLRSHNITEVDTLWSYAITFAKQHGFEMGGGYASFGKEITVILLKDGIRERFKISLKEVKQK
jgi:hypothetical protein